MGKQIEVQIAQIMAPFVEEMEKLSEMTEDEQKAYSEAKVADEIAEIAKENPELAESITQMVEGLNKMMEEAEKELNQDELVEETNEVVLEKPTNVELVKNRLVDQELANNEQMKTDSSTIDAMSL